MPVQRDHEANDILQRKGFKKICQAFFLFACMESSPPHYSRLPDEFCGIALPRIPALSPWSRRNWAEHPKNHDWALCPIKMGHTAHSPYGTRDTTLYHSENPTRKYPFLTS